MNGIVLKRIEDFYSDKVYQTNMVVLFLDIIIE